MEFSVGEYVILKSDKDKGYTILEIEGERIKCIDSSGRMIYLSLNEVEKFKI